MNRSLISLLFALVVAVAAHGQLPQFSSTSFEDWVYTNPAVELNRDNILNNKIYLYTTSERLRAVAGISLTWMSRGSPTSG